MLTPSVRPPFPMAWGFSTKLDAPEELPPVRLSQVHGCGVVEAGEDVVEADGLWTTSPGRRIGVRVADCVPVLLAGLLPGRVRWVAALHAGWRGATAGILRRGVTRYLDLGGARSDLVWALGPSILACHFEVGEEVVAAAQQDPAWRNSFRTEGPHGRPHLDLHGFLKAQALDMGLEPENDGSISICTVCRTDLLWSWRRGDKEGRQWGWIEIV